MSYSLHQALSQDDLVVRAQAGETAALHLLVKAVRTAVHRYCQARLSTYSGGTEVAEDVTQEACVAVLDALHRYQDQGAPFAAFVYAIAGHKVADAQRRFARAPFALVEEVPDRAEPALGPEQQTIVREDVATVLALLERLPERTAQVVRLRAEGRSAVEVGELLGMSAGAVRVVQHRGLARLRELVAASSEHRERFADRWLAKAA